MGKFHINKHGIPAPCKAKPGNCPLGGDDTHFDTKDEAQIAINSINKEKHGILPGMDKISEKSDGDKANKADSEKNDVQKDSEFNYKELEDDVESLKKEVREIDSIVVRRAGGNYDRKKLGEGNFRKMRLNQHFVKKYGFKPDSAECKRLIREGEIKELPEEKRLEVLDEIKKAEDSIDKYVSELNSSLTAPNGYDGDLIIPENYKPLNNIIKSFDNYLKERIAMAPEEMKYLKYMPEEEVEEFFKDLSRRAYSSVSIGVADGYLYGPQGYGENGYDRESLEYVEKRAHRINDAQDTYDVSYAKISKIEKRLSKGNIITKLIDPRAILARIRLDDARKEFIEARDDLKRSYLPSKEFDKSMSVRAYHYNGIINHFRNNKKNLDSFIDSLEVLSRLKY